MVHWAVELFEFDVQYEPRGPIKGQIYANFVVELFSEAPQVNGEDFQWVSPWMALLTSRFAVLV